jgi:voltage-gated potassium channel
MSAQSVWRSWRNDVHNILEVGGQAHPASYFVNAFIIALIVVNAIAFAAETVPDVAAKYGAGLDHFNNISVAIFTVEYILRVWSAVDIPMLSRLPHWRARLRFMLRPIMIIDLLAVLPHYLQWLIPIDLRILRVFRVFRLLKIARYSPALQTLGRVLEDEYRTLIGALVVMLIVLLFTSTAMYFLERGAQPDKFGSIPAAAWWSLSTLTTVGYGDVVPVTPLGKVVGGLVMVLGLCMFALPVAIIASGFSQESSRHQFVVTLSMVERVPLFSTMYESEIAEITKLLYTRTYLPGVPIVRAGDPGGAMYLMASGEAIVAQPKGKQTILKDGDFFGEMALLEQRRHRHSVIAKTRCRVYVLDSEALARLARRNPEILQQIRDVARRRRAIDDAVDVLAKRPRHARRPKPIA